jgi:beta-glucanase (GH16 family)
VDPGTAFSDANIDWVSDHVNVGRQFLTFDSSAPCDPTVWHTYGLDWEPGSLTYYLDGAAIFSVTNAADVPTNSMFMILNLAVGGDWPGSPDGSTVFSAHMMIDYVHVYQH